MPQTYLMLLWHMHQPFYKDLAEDVYTMPWVRLHSLKDYYGMVAVMRDFPSVHATFNLVPSLVLQIEDYARDTAREPAYDLAFKPVDDMTAADREACSPPPFRSITTICSTVTRASASCGRSRRNPAWRRRQRCSHRKIFLTFRCSRRWHGSTRFSSLATPKWCAW